MHLGFRYHLASLMAVFLSLVLGILIGGALFQDSVLVEEQGLIISEMEGRFQNLQSNLTILEEQLDFSEKSWHEIRDLLIEGSLEGKSIHLVDLGAQRGLGPVEKVLKAAGASPLRLKAGDLESLSVSDGLFLLVQLNDDEIPPKVLLDLERLVSQGTHLTFVWGSGQQPALARLPSSLQIDCVETVWGEIALIRGLIGESIGHYGLWRNALGLFP
ncbi:MAG: copper transporter [Firmicutes bacterium]|nr:copper transporter [Bacillota bacterium]